jgi:hypothetical protein
MNRGTQFWETEMKQTAFKTCKVVNIQMVRERILPHNGNRVSASEQAAEAFCALVGNSDRERLPLSVNFIMAADVNWYDLMTLDEQLKGDTVTDVD